MGSTIAWINCSPAQDTYTAVPWMRGWLSGARARAEGLGYGLEEFWLHTKMPPERLLQILTARGTAGPADSAHQNNQGDRSVGHAQLPPCPWPGPFRQANPSPGVHKQLCQRGSSLEEMSRMGYRKIGFFSHLLPREWAIRQFIGALSGMAGRAAGTAEVCTVAL